MFKGAVTAPFIWLVRDVNLTVNTFQPCSWRVFCSAGFSLRLLVATLGEVMDTKFDRKEYNFLQRCKIICNETTCCGREQRLGPVWHDQRSPSHRYLYDQHHHLSVAVFHISKFWTSLHFHLPLSASHCSHERISNKSVVFLFFLRKQQIICFQKQIVQNSRL